MAVERIEVDEKTFTEKEVLDLMRSAFDDGFYFCKHYSWGDSAPNMEAKEDRKSRMISQYIQLAQENRDA